MTRTVAEARELRHDALEHLPRGLLLATLRADRLQLVDRLQVILTRGIFG